MFTADVVKIPEKVKFNKKNSGIYVYHIFNHTYSKEKKYTTDKRVLIGKKIDDKTMHPNPKYFELYGEKPKKEEAAPREFSNTLSVGDTMLLQSIGNNIGLSTCLEQIYGEDDKNMIIDLATYHIIENSSIYQHYPTYAFKHPVLAHKVVSDSRICQFLGEKINEEKIHNFFKKWIDCQKLDGNVLISYDSTNFNCESEGIELLEYGNAKEDRQKKIVNLSYVFDQKNGTPLFYELYSGSIVDIAECKKMLRKAKKFGLNHAIFVADRGYFSNSNITQIMNNFDGFIMMAKIGNKKITELLDKERTKVPMIPNYIEKHGVFGMKFCDSLFKDDAECEKRFFYVYFNQTKYNTDKELLTILANKNYREGSELIGTELDDDADAYKYCKFIVDENKIIKSVEFKQELFEENLKNSGYFVIVSSINDEPSKILDLYRNRDSIEKCFRSLKTDLGFDTLGVQSDRNLRSKVFITFIASILRNHVLKSLETLRLTNKKDFTVNSALKNLSRIEATKFGDKSHEVLYTLTKTQKDIIKACGVNLSSINKNYPHY